MENNEKAMGHIKTNGEHDWLVGCSLLTPINCY